MISSFIIDEISSQPFDLPTSLEGKYVELINDFRREINGFGSNTYSLCDTSKESTAWQFDRYFPAHFFKSYYSLLQMEADRTFTPEEDCLLSQPFLTVIDVGCGSGAASLAFLHLLQKYQQYRATQSAPVMPVSVSVIGMDPNPHMLNLYSVMCEEFAGALESNFVKVEFTTFEGEFPQDMRRLLREYDSNNNHSTLLILSNIIRVLRKLHKTGKTGALEQIWNLLAGRRHFSGIFGAAEGLAVQGVIDEWDVNYISILGVATTGSNLRPHQWRDGLKDLQDGLEEAVKPHRIESKTVDSSTICYYNPRNSYWLREVGYSLYSRKRPFYYSYCRVVRQNFDNDRQWREVIDLTNLELAWARTRRHNMIDEVLPDECEARLFEYYLHDRLTRLRNLLLMEKWESLRVAHTLFFEVPKKPNQTRPKITARFEEQILSAALVEKLGYGVKQGRSFSHRLISKPVEYLYEHWWRLYKQFLIETRKLAAQAKQVLRADVAKFYQNIDQEVLLDILNRELTIGGKTERALEHLIRREFPVNHHPGEGLPQGQIASGFWSNLYLKQVDEAFDNLDGVKYARYADDIVFAIDPKNTSTDSVRMHLETLLSVLHLETSEDKTFPQTGNDYRKQVSLDQEIDRLASEISKLRVKLFYLDKDYTRRYSEDRWKFIEVYHRLLKTLDIHISPGWMSRKIEQKRRDNPFQVFFGMQRLKLPPFPNSEQEYDGWRSTFGDLNSDWMLKLNDARTQLVNFVEVALRMLDPEEDTDAFVRNLHSTRLKFAVNRLCSLGLTPIAETIAEEVINRPWLIKVPWVCRGLSNCKRHDLLLKVLEESGAGFVTAHALRALGTHTYISEVEMKLWAVLMDTGATIPEKIKASEGLLDGDNWSNADFDTCVSIIEEEDDPYLRKNYILIIGQSFGEESRQYLEFLQSQDLTPIESAAIQYLLNSGFERIFSNHEPDVLLDYYDRYYPDDESDDKSDESNPNWIPSY